MHPFLKLAYTVLLCLLASLSLTTVSLGDDRTTDQPNVVIYLSDDHSQFDCELYGADDIPTPNFKKLAADGMMFTHAFVASPSCAPSRAAMLTGLMPARNGAEANHTYPKDGTHYLLDDLKKAGYEVAAFGKVAHGKKHGAPFDHAKPGASYQQLQINVAQFLESRESTKPLCLFVGISNPHVPWPKESSFDPAEVKFPPTHLDTPATRVHRAAYYQEIKEVDLLLGELRTLSTKHLGDNVLFMHSADHGSQWPFGKWTLYDYGTRVPLMVSWPGKIKPGIQTDAMISWVDLLPTVLNLAGGSVPENIDGKSFANVLTKNEAEHRNRIFTTTSGDGKMNVYPIRSVRTRKWKLIHNLHPEFAFTNHSDLHRKPLAGGYWTQWAKLAETNDRAKKIVDRYYKRPEWEFFNVENDKWEETNLIDDPEHSSTIASLKKELKTWMESQGDQQTVFNEPRLLSNLKDWHPDFDNRQKPKRGKGKANAPKQRPNVIIMMADDMGMGDTSAYHDWTGNADKVQIKTPAMESLARMGIRFTDAHSPSSRCTATRQALLTGRYTWRTRLKHSVLWGPQGNPLIEPGRPTLATLLRGQGYRTGMSGKWHCGLSYRNSDGNIESDWNKVDLTQGIADGPINHGFDFFHGTSRSHPTSKDQGWLLNDKVPAALGGTQVDRSKYVLKKTGPTNYAKAKQFLTKHVSGEQTKSKPFFLYYACHSNHTSHDPCVKIEGHQVRGASNLGSKRGDFIFENDVVLKLLLDWLSQTDDPRRQGNKLIDNTLVIFTSDNGAENKSKTATGPIRSNKGSVYEGGHRVPFIAAWKLGGIGDGDSGTNGQSSDFPICHVDLFATLAEITGTSLPENGAEDSFSILSALKNNAPESRPPLFHNDHNEGAKAAGVKARQKEAAWLAIRIDDPKVEGKTFEGQWKLFVDHQLLHGGVVNIKELYELNTDRREQKNRIDEPTLKPLINFMANKMKAIHDRGGIRKSR